ncbi:MAG: DUF2442 domain-containing protein [Magnetococcales bacterium]|nr:DUF2442 domain-containing protein [Magnetococcales bacterium]NGZ28171.1 DUF2442 domain-containing protein [Magnetococcales bacterium]
MKSVPPGSNISSVEVTHVSLNGFWLLLDDQEMFLPFDQFPWFLDATMGQLFHVERMGKDHLYWPELDVDLSVDSIHHPEQFPLVSRLSHPSSTMV